MWFFICLKVVEISGVVVLVFVLLLSVMMLVCMCGCIVSVL